MTNDQSDNELLAIKDISMAIVHRHAGVGLSIPACRRRAEGPKYFRQSCHFTAISALKKPAA